MLITRRTSRTVQQLCWLIRYNPDCEYACILQQKQQQKIEIAVKVAIQLLLPLFIQLKNYNFGLFAYISCLIVAAI